MPFYSTQLLLISIVSPDYPKNISTPPMVGQTLKIIDTDATSLISGRCASKNKELLTPYSIKELSGWKVRKVTGMDAGYAIKPDGDIVNLFNNTHHKGMGVVNIIDAIQNGGKTLDCVDGPLYDLYASLGIKEYKRTPFDRQYAPANWNYEKYGTPDIVFLRHEGETNVNYLKRSYEAKWNQRLDADPVTAKLLDSVNRASFGETPGGVVSGTSKPIKEQGATGTSVQRTLGKPQGEIRGHNTIYSIQILLISIVSRDYPKEFLDIMKEILK